MSNHTNKKTLLAVHAMQQTARIIATHSADTFTTIMVENERFAAAFNELFVKNIQHFEERSIAGDILHFKCIEVAFCFWPILTPYFERKIYIFIHFYFV
mgnify:CR=1 FL=1